MQIDFRTANFRAIPEMKHQEFQPITLVIGRNGAGKSGFVQALPLLRQSMASRRDGQAPLKWDGGLVNFTDFKTAVTGGDADREIGFGFRADRLKLENGWGTERTFQDAEYEVRTGTNEHGDALLRSVAVQLDGASLIIRYKGERQYHCEECDRYSVKTRIDGKEMDGADFGSHPVLGDFSFPTEIQPIPGIKVVRRGLPHERTARELIRRAMQEHLVDTRIEAAADETPGCRLADELQAVGDQFEFDAAAIPAGNPFRLLDQAAQEQAALFCKAQWLFEALLEMTRLAKAFTERISYLGPRRQPLREIYDLAGYNCWTVDPADDMQIPSNCVTMIEPDGGNLPDYLMSMERPEFDRFAAWCDKHLAMRPVREFRHPEERQCNCYGNSPTEFRLRLRQGDIEAGGGQIGQGATQLLPVLAQLWLLMEKPPADADVPQIAIFEHPDAFLHAKQIDGLADAMLDAVKARPDLRLVVETNHKHLLDEFCEDVARERLRRGDLGIVRVADERWDESKDEWTAQTPAVVRCWLNSKGMLENWPLGFMGI